jgi:hypothetical protein
MPTVHVLYGRTSCSNHPVGRLRLDPLARVLPKIEEEGAFSWGDGREGLAESSFAGEHAWTFFQGLGAPGRRTL